MNDARRPPMATRTQEAPLAVRTQMTMEPNIIDAERYQNFSIELDCPPGNPRPGDLIAGVLAKTGLRSQDFTTAPPFFGHQTWILKRGAKKDETFTKAKPVLKERITKLYHDGLIRYGTW